MANNAEPSEWVPQATPDGIILSPIDMRSINSGFKQLESRLQKRIVFGMLALQPIMAAETGTVPLRSWAGRWNRAEAIRLSQDVNALPDRRNFERDIWRSVPPVAHLVAAWTDVLLKDALTGDIGGFFRLMNDYDLLKAVLGRAEQLESVIERSDLRIPASILIKFRL